nr:capsid protein precursor pIIIa [Tawny frogmouth aviadenovirus A]
MAPCSARPFTISATRSEVPSVLGGTIAVCSASSRLAYGEKRSERASRPSRGPDSAPATVSRCAEYMGASAANDSAVVMMARTPY